MKRFLERDLGWTTLSARTIGHSISYLMKDPTGRHLATMEFKPEGSITVTIGNETRIIPGLEDISKTLKLNKEAAVDSQKRLLYQVLERLIRNHRDESQVDIEDMMERFSRGKL